MIDREWIDALLLVIIVLSLILNGVTNLALIKKWNKLGTLDIILFTLTVSDFLQALIGYPLEIGSTLQGDTIECTIAAFSTSTLALISISLLTSLSAVRMVSICYPMESWPWMQRKRNGIYIAVPSVLYGFLWGVFPLIGWSKYAPELGYNQRCTINLNDKDFNTTSYLYCLVIFCYMLPISIMMFCFFKIRIEMQKIFKKRLKRRCSTDTRTKPSIERNTSHLVLIMVLVFLFCWTPYAILVLFVSINKKISKAYADCAAMLGKSSTIYDPIIYFIVYKRYRKYAKQLFCKKHQYSRGFVCSRLSCTYVWTNNMNSAQVIRCEIVGNTLKGML